VVSSVAFSNVNKNQQKNRTPRKHVSSAKQGNAVRTKTTTPLSSRLNQNKNPKQTKATCFECSPNLEGVTPRSTVLVPRRTGPSSRSSSQAGPGPACPPSPGRRCRFVWGTWPLSQRPPAQRAPERRTSVGSSGNSRAGKSGTTKSGVSERSNDQTGLALVLRVKSSCDRAILASSVLSTKPCDKRAWKNEDVKRKS